MIDDLVAIKDLVRLFSENLKTARPVDMPESAHYTGVELELHGAPNGIDLDALADRIGCAPTTGNTKGIALTQFADGKAFPLKAYELADLLEAAIERLGA